jgi:hypothetical protein
MLLALILLDRPNSHFQPTHAFPQSRDYADTESRIVTGERLPPGRRHGRRRTPFCGEIPPQRPERESADGVSVTG